MLHSPAQIPFARRTNRPISNGDYQIADNDLGVVLNTAGTTATLPPMVNGQSAREYGVKNGSAGPVTVTASPGEFIVIQGQLVSSVTIPADYSRQFARETSTQHFIII